MSYTPPVGAEETRSSEARFAKFFLGYWIIVIIACVILPQKYWEKNILWGIGSMLILFSVLHARYFDIKKNSNPMNLSRIGGNCDIKNIYKKVEVFANHSWVAGFVFLALSRFLQI